MPIATEKYIRKPLYVDAVRITGANFDEIASWCQGEVQQDEVPGKGPGKKYIKVRVHNPKNPRQTKAFIGDWLLYTERGYKVYTNKAFHASFDVVEKPQSVAEVVEAAKEAAQSEGLLMAPGISEEIEFVPATPQNIADAVAANVAAQSEQPENVETVVEQEKIAVSAVEGKRVLSKTEQEELGAEEVREMVQSGEAVLAQDIATA